MSKPEGLRRLFRLPMTLSRVRREVSDEIAFHIDQRAADLVDAGLSPDAARAQAAREFGDTAAAQHDLESIGRRRLRRERRANWWGDFRRDLGFAGRSVLRAPMFSLLAIMTLAVGIGANAAIFAVARPVLLDPLPYADQARLLRVYATAPDGSGTWGLTAGMADEIVRSQRAFSQMAIFSIQPSEVVVGGDGAARMANGAWVQPQFLDVLGVAPTIGRNFSIDDFPGGATDDLPSVVTVLSHGAWQQHAGGVRDIVGRDVIVNGIPRTVVGVLPRGFVGPIGDVDFYFPLNLGPTLADPVRVRRSHWLGLLGRMAPGSTLAGAGHETAAIVARLAGEFPDDFGGIGSQVMSLRQAMVGDTRGPLVVLLASAVLVLLVACSNLSGALLSRVLSRRKEFGVRAAIGAGRGRLARQLLTEALALAAAGGVAGVVLAALLLALLRDLALASLPHFADIALDGGTLLAILLLTVLAGLLVGALPALAIARGDPQRALGDSTRGSSESPRSRRLRGVLVSGQIALCLSLVVSAGLLGRSLWNMSAAPPGYDSNGVVVSTVKLPFAAYGTPEAIVAFQDAVSGRLAALPGIAAVAAATSLPRAVGEQNSFVIEGRRWADGEADPWALWSSVSDDYFPLLRIPLLAGRTFDSRDHADASPVIIINEGMARRYWPAGDALGARIRIGPDREAPLHEVIGIVGDVRNDVARSDAQPITYTSLRQAPEGVLHFLLRARGSPQGMLAQVEREVAAQDHDVALRRTMLLDDVLAEGLADRRLPVLLMICFGALALLLASVGVYAMFASMATAREHEFGVRMALGANRGAIAALVLRQGGIWMAAGLLAGLVGVIGVALLLGELLFEVSPFDPLVLGVAILVLVGCAAVASLTPIRRATRVDPAVVLQSA
jgi:putative ABC transport system permease protein